MARTPPGTARSGLVPAVLEKAAPPSDAVLVTCGPPIMIKFVILAATKMGFKPEDMVTTLEMKMKCGVGLCGRCNIGSKLRLQGRAGLHAEADTGAS